jgi:glycopeptide antibiotics resistance protein
MEINRKKIWTWVLFMLYMFIVTLIILVKNPWFFKWRMAETFRRHHFEMIGFKANYKPLATIRNLLNGDFDTFTIFLNIGGNILLFIPLGIFLPMYFKTPSKAVKTIVTSFLLSTGFEVFQLLTACGFFDVDDIFLNTLGGAIGLFMYKLFIKYSNYSQKKLVATYAPK